MNENSVKEILDKSLQDLLNNTEEEIQYINSCSANGINSLGYIKLLVILEEAFEIEFPDEALNIDYYSNLNELIADVVKLKKGVECFG